MHRLLFLLSSVLFLGCSGPKAIVKSFNKAGDASFVRFERTACFGTCPVYEVIIRGDGSLVYVGKEFAQPKGTYKAQLSPEDLRSLHERIAISGFFEMENEYDGPISDLPSAITEVFINDKRKKKILNRWEGPEDLTRLETYIDQLWQKYLTEK